MEQKRISGDSAGAEAAGEGTAQRSVQSVEVGGRLLLALAWEWRRGLLVGVATALGVPVLEKRFELSEQPRAALALLLRLLVLLLLVLLVLVLLQGMAGGPAAEGVDVAGAGPAVGERGRRENAWRWCS